MILRTKQHQPAVAHQPRQLRVATLAPHWVRCSAGVGYVRDTSLWSIFQPLETWKLELEI